ncbi:MAG: Ppx/GppA family phosphatase [Alphaproteobacteria bacterium]|nr:Ppx/GppA family phosphatase [Alphaproteobacteria bacterium]
MARSDQTSTSQPAAGRAAHTYAAIDLGTNNCRLLVAQPDGDGFQVIDAFSRIVRLGEGLVATNRLADPAMGRTIEALRVCADKVRRSGASRVRAVATEACRRAENGDDFVARAFQESGIQLEIIETQEEARLALTGCAPLYDPPDGDDSYALLFDIGGGSTQVTWLRLDEPLAGCAHPDFTVLGSVSLPCGVVTLSEKFEAVENAQGEVSLDAYVAVCDHVSELLEPFEREFDIATHVAAGRVQMVGASGTVTTITGVLLDLPRYNRARVDGHALTFDEIIQGRNQLMALNRSGRAAHPCIGPQRADLVIAGCAVLHAICDAWPVGRLRVADRGLREGILHGLMRDADREAALAG